MARRALRPVPSNGLLVLLVLLSGEPVFAGPEDAQRNPQGSICSPIWQFPRFMARKRSYDVNIVCFLEVTGNVSWFWKQDMDSELKGLPVKSEHFKQTQGPSNATLTIKNIGFADNGIYVCEHTRADGTLEKGFGSELRVMGFSSLNQLKRRNTLKDGIIMIQTLLIILFITVPIFLLLDKDDSKAGMEEDHTYEGLNIDQTATYEDIVTLRTGEVKWSVGEHPGEE